MSSLPSVPLTSTAASVSLDGIPASATAGTTCLFSKYAEVGLVAGSSKFGMVLLAGMGGGTGRGVCPFSSSGNFSGAVEDLEYL